MVKLRRMPKSFKQMRAEKNAGLNVYGGHRKTEPDFSYYEKSNFKDLSLAASSQRQQTRGYTTPEGVYMSPEYIDNLQTDKPVGQGKGLKGENCNRTACQAPGAYWYNHSTQAYYCRTCADLINRANRHDSFVRDLGHDLLTLDPDFADKARERR